MAPWRPIIRTTLKNKSIFLNMFIAFRSFSFAGLLIQIITLNDPVWISDRHPRSAWAAWSIWASISYERACTANNFKAAGLTSILSDTFSHLCWLRLALLVAFAIFSSVSLQWLRNKIHAIIMTPHYADDCVPCTIADKENITYFDRSSRLYKQRGQHYVWRYACFHSFNIYL